MAKKKDEAFRIEDALARLEELAGELEEGSLDLEQSLAHYREARALHAQIVARLTKVEEEVRTLMEADGNPEEVV